MSEKEKVYYKRKTATWRKRHLYDYLGGELSKETRMIQWTHTALEDIIFDLAQQNKFLSFERAIKRYKLNKKTVTYLIQNGFIKARIDKNDDRNMWLFSKNVDENINTIDEGGKIAFKKQSKRKDRQDKEYIIEDEQDDNKEQEEPLPF
tara:strand:+ start:1259 stop:1705 length:447 start_codon:yes stop_codon:yes gene_type:complete